MDISINTGCLDRKIGLKKAIDVFSEAGFQALDLSLCGEFIPEKTYFFGDDYMEKVAEIKEYIAEKGMYFNQAHAYFPTSYDDEEKNKVAVEHIIKDMEIASAFGIKYIVVHPNCHLDYFSYRAAEKTKEMNYKFYKSILPYAEKYNINICIENLFEWKMAKYPILGRCSDNACSRPEQFIEFIDMLESDRVFACVDVGHAVAVSQDPANMIRALGKRVKALHIHDNDGRVDNHAIPFSPSNKSIDWDSVCKALVDIGYDRELTFETDGSYAACTTPEIALPLAKYNYEIGKVLVEKIEKYKSEL